MSPTVEILFTINLDVLSLVLYGWRILEDTVRIRLKTRGRRLKSKTWEHQKTTHSREHQSTRAHPKASIPTLKPSSTQEPTSTRARYTMLILQQHRNIALSINIQASQSHTKPIDTSKLYWTLHCTSERRNPAPPTRTQTQASLTRKPWQATHPTPSTGRNLHNKEEPQTFSIEKGHPKYTNLNKMKRQRNI